jgi:hypothetical protein
MQTVHEADNDACTGQELLGKHERNLSVIKPDIAYNSAILSPKMFLATLANNAAYFHTA